MWKGAVKTGRTRLVAGGVRSRYITRRAPSIKRTSVTSISYPAEGRCPAKTATTIWEEKSTNGGTAAAPACRCQRVVHSSCVRATVQIASRTPLRAPRRIVENATPGSPRAICPVAMNPPTTIKAQQIAQPHRSIPATLKRRMTECLRGRIICRQWSRGNALVSDARFLSG